MEYPIDYKEEQKKFYKKAFENAKNTNDFESWYNSITYSGGYLDQKEMFILSVNKCQWEVMKDSWVSYDPKDTIYQSWTGLPNSWVKIKKSF